MYNKRWLDLKYDIYNVFNLFDRASNFYLSLSVFLLS
jgi:hypothetical protein